MVLKSTVSVFRDVVPFVKIYVLFISLFIVEIIVLFHRHFLKYANILLGLVYGASL